MLETKLSHEIYKTRFALYEGESWESRCRSIVDIADCWMTSGELSNLYKYIVKGYFLPAGRVIRSAGRKVLYLSNCYAFQAEDTREGWAQLAYDVMVSSSTGGGFGNNYSNIRAKGTLLKTVGGIASGPISLLRMIDGMCKEIRNGGTRRVAGLGSLDSMHPDIDEWIKLKQVDGALPCHNISVIFQQKYDRDIYRKTIASAIKYGSPGILWYKYADQKSNACGEYLTRTNRGECILGSVNMGAIPNLDTFIEVVRLGIKFLYACSKVGDLPNELFYAAREKDLRLGLGLMGVHEWMIKRRYPYGESSELTKWMEAYRENSEIVPANRFRAIAPTGTISILANTTSGIEPVFAHGYICKYYEGEKYCEKKTVDPVVDRLVNQGINPDEIETSYDISPERRIEFQAYMQDFVDMAISSTVNLPEPSTDVDRFSFILDQYKDRLKGITFYPNGAKGNQPLSPLSYREAKESEPKQVDICHLTGGKCGE